MAQDYSPGGSGLTRGAAYREREKKLLGCDTIQENRLYCV